LHKKLAQSKTITAAHVLSVHFEQNHVQLVAADSRIAQ